jgi:hypothetical protein
MNAPDAESKDVLRRHDTLIGPADISPMAAWHAAGGSVALADLRQTESGFHDAVNIVEVGKYRRRNWQGASFDMCAPEPVVSVIYLERNVPQFRTASEVIAYRKCIYCAAGGRLPGTRR